MELRSTSLVGCVVLRLLTEKNTQLVSGLHAVEAGPHLRSPRKLISSGPVQRVADGSKFPPSHDASKLLPLPLVPAVAIATGRLLAMVAAMRRSHSCARGHGRGPSMAPSGVRLP